MMKPRNGGDPAASDLISFFSLAQKGKVDLVFLFDDPLGGEIYPKQTKPFARTNELYINPINHPIFNSI